MALTTAQYTAELKQRQAVLARLLGLDPLGLDFEARTTITIQAASQAALIRLLVLKGVFTDAELAQAFNVAAVDTYPREPLYITTDPPGPTP